MLLDQRLDGVQRVSQVLVDQEALLLCHPGVRLLCVPVEQLEVHALLVEHPAVLPQLEQAGLVLLQSNQLLLHLLTGVVTRLKKHLSSLSCGTEAVLPSVDLALVLLVAFKKSFRTRYILGQLISRDDSLHVRDP